MRRLQKIKYDYLPKYCCHCRLQGHDNAGCWNSNPELRPKKEEDKTEKTINKEKNKVTENQQHPTQDNKGI